MWVAWMRLKGPIYNIFVVVTYVPHKGRTAKPTATDTIEALGKLLTIVSSWEET